MANQTYYDVLGIDDDADQTQIKRAFRAFARTNHPDVGGDDQAFARGNEAFEVLSDPTRRRDYDRSLKADAKSQVEEGAAPPPQNEPETAKAQAFEGEVKVTTGYVALRPLAGVALASTALTSAPLLTHAKVGHVAIALALGAVAGIVGSVKFDLPALRSRWFVAAGVLIALHILTTLAAWLYVPWPWRTAAAGVVSMVAMMALVPTLRALRSDAKVVSMKDAHTGWMFGTPSPGAASRSLEEIIDVVCANRPDVRVMRRDHDGYYTVALVAGRSVLFLRALASGNGEYVWHGASLLVRHDRAMDTAISGDYLGVNADLERRLRAVRVASALVVLAPLVTSNESNAALPSVLPANELAALIDGCLDRGVVDRSVVVSVLRAWHEADR